MRRKIDINTANNNKIKLYQTAEMGDYQETSLMHNGVYRLEAIREEQADLSYVLLSFSIEK